jgi:filamentous hemagglutinin family protein
MISAARASGTSLPALVSVLALGSGGHALAQLPTGGQVAAGTGAISTSGNTMTINQTSQRLVTDWQSFSVGTGHTVQFVQPSSSAAALNRVLGADVSTIQGSIRANGQVFLVNPNGVLFTPTAQVNVGALVASTLGITNENFLAGRLRFEGTSTHAVINQGSLNASQGGSVALIAARIVNEPGASVIADRGQVLMGAGSKVTLDLGGPVRIRVEEGALQALIDQGGAVRADGGLVYLTAKAADALSRTVIRHTGVTRAQTVATGEKGEIFLMGGMEKDSISVGGTLDASAPTGGNGGFIETSAGHVTIAEGVRVTTAAASGVTGNWLIDPVDFYIKSTGGNITGAALGTALATTDVTIDTSQANQFAACTGAVCTNSAGSNGDIFVLDDITRASGGAAKTLTLLAVRNIEIGSSSQAVAISGSATNPLNLVLSARSAGGAAGHVQIYRATIKTFGGNVTIGGGDGSASGYAIARAQVALPGGDEGSAGVRIRSSIIDASSDGAITTGSTSSWLGAHTTVTQGSASNLGGNIVIRGQGNAASLGSNPNLGIWIYAGSSLTTAGSGTITLQGTGGQAPNTYGRVGSTGVVMEGSSPLIAKDGDITITGLAGAGFGAYGVAFTEGGGRIKTGGRLIINAADGTASDNDNAVLIRDGNFTFDLGGASEIHAPLVGGTNNTAITANYAFTKRGTGSLTLLGDVPTWNTARPANTPMAYNAGSFDLQDGDLLLGTGLSMAQALYSFWQPPRNDTSFRYSVGTIGGGTLMGTAPGEPIRISASRESRLALGIIPDDATPQEREQAQANRTARMSMIYRGIAPPNPTALELRQAQAIRQMLIRAGNTSAEGLSPEEMKEAQANRAKMIASGVWPPYGELTKEERKNLNKGFADRKALIARGGTPMQPFRRGELEEIDRVRKALVASGQLPPNATPAERAQSQRARSDMVARGVRPPGASFSESVAAARNAFGRGIGRLFGR